VQNEAAPYRILILFAHPALQKSRVNRRMIRAARDLPGITIHDLYEAYPDFDIDVSREQKLLLEHDILVLHHPFYWYSSPAIVKEWEDLVLTHGWAYGHAGRALHGKKALSVITTGGGEEAYQREGHNRFTIRELLAPIEQTARLCGMDYLPPFAVHGTHSFTPTDIERHATDYRRLLVALRDGTVDLETARSHPRLNTDLESILTS
jgi:glutathione-regulated potassium-efflux system ancillary protein KefG